MNDTVISHELLSFFLKLPNILILCVAITTVGTSIGCKEIVVWLLHPSPQSTCNGSTIKNKYNCWSASTYFLL